MAIIASAKGGGNFNPVSEGVHLATCIWIIDLGEQWSEIYKKAYPKVMITWEIPDEIISTDEGEKPKVISREYTLSLSEKSVLRSHLESWRGKKFTEAESKGFDLKNVLGKGCQIQILHTEKGDRTYANISSIMTLPKGSEKSVAVNKTVFFDLTDPDCLNQFDQIPNWIQDKIKKSDTYKQIVNAQFSHPSQDFQEIPDPDDLPF